MLSKPGTEIAKSGNHEKIIRKKDRQPSNIPEKVSEQTSQEALGSVT